MGLGLRPVKEIRLPFVPNAVNTLYSPGISANFAERDNILLTQNARRIKVEHKLRNRVNDQLYWSVVVETSGSLLPLACMRNHFRRQWREAFIKALKQNGFDCKGRSVLGSLEKAHGVGLRGTLEIRIYNAIYWGENNKNKMLQHSNSIVKGLMNLR